METTHLLKRALVKRYALECSQKLRAGKFKRVGLSFIIAVEAQADTAIRRLAVPREVPAKSFLQTPTKKRILEQVDCAVAAIIEGKVKAHPSVGITLLD